MLHIPKGQWGVFHGCMTLADFIVLALTPSSNYHAHVAQKSQQPWLWHASPSPLKTDNAAGGSGVHLHPHSKTKIPRASPKAPRLALHGSIFGLGRLRGLGLEESLRWIDGSERGMALGMAREVRGAEGSRFRSFLLRPLPKHGSGRAFFFLCVCPC